MTSHSRVFLFVSHLATPMSLLGHTARFVLSCPNPEESRQQWEFLGFEDVGSAAGSVRLSDGQIFLTLVSGDVRPLACAYFAPSLQSVGDKLVAAGIAIEGNASTQWRVAGPGSLEWWIHPAHPSDMLVRTGEGSPLLGYFDALVCAVPDAEQAAEMAQKMGYVIIDAWPEPMPQVDLTDGLLTLSFRTQAAANPVLHYTADLDEYWISEAVEGLGESVVIHRNTAGQAVLAVISMPDGATIMVTPDM